MTEQNSLAREYSFDSRQEDPLEELARIVSGEKKPAPKPQIRPVERPVFESPAPAYQAGQDHAEPDYQDAAPSYGNTESDVDGQSAAQEAGDPDVDFENELMLELDDTQAGQQEARAAEFSEDTTAFDQFDAIVDDIAEAAEEENDASLEDQLMVELGLSEQDTGEFLTGFEEDVDFDAPAQATEQASAPQQEQPEEADAEDDVDLMSEFSAQEDFTEEDLELAQELEAVAQNAAPQRQGNRQSLNQVSDFKDKFESELAISRAAQSLSMRPRASEADSDDDDDLAALGFDPSIWDQPATAAKPRAQQAQPAAKPAANPVQEEAPLNFDSAFEAEMASMDAPAPRAENTRPPAAQAPQAPRQAQKAPMQAPMQAPEQASAQAQQVAEAQSRQVVRAAPPTTPPSMFNSEREIDDHFAAVFAEELGFDEPVQPQAPARAPQQAPQHARAQISSGHQSVAVPQAPVSRAAVPAQGDFAGDDYDDRDTYADDYDPSDGYAQDEVAQDAFGDGYDEYDAYEDEGDFQASRDDRYEEPSGRSGGRGFRLAGIALGLALVVGLGAVSYGFFRGDSTPSEPAIVRADPDPVKTRPEDPGGTTVANQDKAAYERVAGKFGEEAKQEKLVSDVEEPVNLVSSAPPAASGLTQTGLSGKGDERLSPGEQQALVSPTTLQPRRVRTLTVRRDGTIVTPTDPAAPEASDASANADGAIPLDGATTTGGIPVPSPRPERSESSAAPLQPAARPAATASSDQGSLPGVSVGQSVVPVVPVPGTDSVTTQSVVAVNDAATPVALAPTEQPTPATQAIASQAELSEWVVQISSQRSPEEAQASYQNLVNRFPSLLEGRPMAVQKADIPDKGVFYRVRIGAESKEDAAGFCQNLQSAGGACFVTR